ncbi:hypothetical protein Leryth_021245 [Lithospermum erythrorhizon]|nr:hypothetical protein Leryth_021245 [Lithospermum erythrorhizon]
MDIWKKITGGRQDGASSNTESGVLNLSESSSVIQQVPEKNVSIRRVLTGKRVKKDTCPEIDLSSRDTSVEEAFNGTYGMETLTLGNLAYSIRHGGGERSSDDYPQTNGELGFCSSPAAISSPLRTCKLKGKVLKPLTSLESCLMAQLYKEHHHTDAYILDTFHSPRTPSNSSFFASGRSRMSSGTGDDFLELPVKIDEKQPEKNVTYLEEEPICGIPSLPRIGDLNLRKRAPRRPERSSNLSATDNGKHQSFEEPPHGVLLFCLGISAGMLSSFVANQQEVDKLNQQLRLTKNLVEDLQDELEMKDSLTVNELAVEDDESQDTHHDSLDNGHSLSPEAKLDDSMEHDHVRCHDEEAEVKSLGKIEAELEAELERLELNMNSCNLEGKLSNLVELEPDLLPDVSVGEFKADLFSRQTGGQSYYADQDGRGISTIHPANYAVSPRELSLRLHEVIESRLEARVKELEAALQNSQRKFQVAEYDHIESWRKFSSSDAEYSSNPTSPVQENEPSCASHPVVINLPDEAQQANLANDLISKLNNSVDDKLHGIISSTHGTSSHSHKQSPCQVQEGWMDNHVDPCLDEEVYNTLSYELSSSRERHSQDECPEKQHIVERARKQGSSVILNAQKALFSGNENGQ